MGPTTAGPVTPTLADAITAVEQAGQTFNNAVAQTTGDQGLATAAHAKADAADAVVATDQTTQSGAASGYVGALQKMVAAAQAQIAALQPPAPGATS